MKRYKNRKKYIYIVLVLLLVFASEIVAAYELTARSFGMGGAFTAMVDDVETVLYNPAGMADDGTVGLNFSVGFSGYNIDEIDELREIGDNINNDGVLDILGGISSNTGLTGQVFFGGMLNTVGLAYNIRDDFLVDLDSSTYSNELLSEGIISYGNTLLEPPFDIGTLAYGFNFKLINVSRESYQVGDTIDKGTKTKTKGNSYGFDLGTLAKVTDNLRVGFVLENILLSDISLKGEERGYSYKDNAWNSEVLDSSYSDKYELGINARLGAAFRVPLIGLTLAADIDNFFASNDGEQIYHFGLEKNLLFNALSLRAGKINGEDVNLTTFGLGLNLTGFSFDLGFGNNSKNSEKTGLLSASMNF